MRKGCHAEGFCADTEASALSYSVAAVGLVYFADGVRCTDVAALSSVGNGCACPTCKTFFLSSCVDVLHILASSATTAVLDVSCVPVCSSYPKQALFVGDSNGGEGRRGRLLPCRGRLDENMIDMDHKTTRARRVQAG